MKSNIKFLIILLYLYSCVTLENEDVILKRSEVEYSSTYNQEENVYVKEVHSQYGVRRILLYSFEQERIIDYSDYYTNLWDIGFYLEDNNKQQSINIFQNNKYAELFPVTLKGEVIGTLLHKNFHDISIAENPKDMIYNRTRNHNGTFRNEIENPKEFNIIKGEGKTSFNSVGTEIKDDYEIIFYTLTGEKLSTGESYFLANLLPERTFVFRTSVGNYVKMELQAVHKNQPSEITRNSKFNYITFRYFIQKDGTRNLLTR